MQGIAASLGNSLVELLDGIAEEGVLGVRRDLTEKVAEAVKEMLALARGMGEGGDGGAGSGERVVQGQGSTEEEGIEESTADPLLLTDADFGNAQGQVQTEELNLDIHKSFEAALSFPAELDTFLWPESHQLPTTQHPQLSGLPSNHTTHPTNTQALHDWFSAKSLLPLHTLDPYNLNLYPTASLAERIDHSALVRACWMLQDPRTTMEVVEKIFPFDEQPAPIHVQLGKIQGLVEGSNPALWRRIDGGSPCK